MNIQPVILMRISKTLYIRYHANLKWESTGNYIIICYHRTYEKITRRDLTIPDS